MSPRADAGPILALVALCAGLLGARSGPSTPMLVAGLLGLLGAWFVAGPARVLVAAIALALLGAALMGRALDGADDPLAPAPAFRGTLVSDANLGRYRADALVRIDGAHRIAVVRATGTDAARLAALEAGDRVTFDGIVGPLPDEPYANAWKWRHAVGVVDGARIRAFDGPSSPVMVVANAIRGVARTGTRPLPPQSRALVHGFMFGDTRGVPDDIADAYRAAGLSHLLAVSGSNVACVLALVTPLLRRQSLYARTATAAAVVAVFAATTRFEPSVLRASALASVGLLATLAGRPASRLRALSLAVIVLLLVDPFLVHSIGFQLSVASSAGIALFAQPLARRLRGPTFVREPLAVSLAAQAGVTPVLLARFGDVPAVTPLTNLVAGPAADALGVYALPASLVGGLVPPLAPVLAPVSQLLVGWVTLVARAGAAVDLSLDGRAALVTAIVAALATLARRGRRSVPDVATR